MQKRLKIWISLFILMGFMACTKARGNKPTVEYMPDMMDSPAIAAQEEGMRMPVPDTLPRDFQKYPFKKEEGDLAGQRLTNPLSINRETMAAGKKYYNTYCIVCHGPDGLGEGTIVPKFPKPPSLHSDKVRNLPDGSIYHVITMGQNLMPSYVIQTFPQERWAIVHYLRALQRAENPTQEDIESYKQFLSKEGKP